MRLTMLRNKAELMARVARGQVPVVGRSLELVANDEDDTVALVIGTAVGELVYKLTEAEATSVGIILGEDDITDDAWADDSEQEGDREVTELDADSGDHDD